MTESGQEIGDSFCLFLSSKRKIEGGACEMIRAMCPNCGKEDAVEVINVLPGRRYELQCNLCGEEFIVPANEALDQQRGKLGY